MEIWNIDGDTLVIALGYHGFIHSSEPIPCLYFNSSD